MPYQPTTQALSDASNTANEQRVGKFWGTRYKSTADMATPTPRRNQRISTPGSNPSTRPASATYVDSPMMRTEKRASHKPSPARPLFQRYLLRELEPTERAPTLTVVFDLDETLVSNRRADLPEALLRSYVIDVLHAVRQLPNVEVVLWTASTEETGGPVVEQLEREKGKIFDDVIFRNDLWFTEPMHTKDLRLLGRSMDRVIVFDNAPNCIKLNRWHGVLVEDYMGGDDPTDNTLVNVFRLIQIMLPELEQGTSVPDLLKKYSLESLHGCKAVFYALPDSWSHVNLRDISPVMVPAQGRFLKITRNRMIQ